MIYKKIDDHLDQFTNFFDAVRSGRKVVEVVEFGFRAASRALSSFHCIKPSALNIGHWKTQ